MKVFSKEKWEKTSPTCKVSKELLRGIPEEKKWWNRCDGKSIEECEEMGFKIIEDWCVEEEQKNMTIKDFIEKKIAIAFTCQKQMKEFAKMCEGYGMRMCRTGDDSVNWLLNNRNTLLPSNGRTKFVHLAYNFHERGVDHGMSWSWNDTIEDEHYTDVGWKIVTFEEFKGKNPSVAYKIVIECDGNDVTNAKMIVNGKIVKSAKAKRNPIDKFNFVTGARLAFDRLFEKKS